MTFKPLTLAVAAASVFAMAAASAQGTGPVRIGFITDMSGVYADIDGQGGGEAIKMAVADFGGKVLGRPIEVVTADHQNKADIAASKAREWIDKGGVTAIFGGTNSGTAIATAKIAGEKKRVYFNMGAGSSRLTNEECTPYTVHYAYDTVALARVAGKAMIQRGDKNWYFLTADYAFGHSLEQDASEIVKSSGGKVVGSVRHPLGASDFSSFLLQAQSSGANVLALANAGGDFVNSVKAAKEFGITKKMKLAGLLVFINDIHSLGLKDTAGLLVTDSWYWDQDAESRKFAQRFFAKFKRMPSSIQAADYSATLTYLNAVKAAGTDDADKVMEALRKTKINDLYTKGGTIRADGKMLHDMYLMQVKSPSESKTPWDYYKQVAKFSGDQAYNSLAESKCPLVKK
ncbi:ABC transporter permease [Comamonas serinivorans]|uniref:ABC transporter permease n=1 Tax=Comamonas serinivorans TaxID=1082851 RepID=A0A1Y0EKY2_9BURK|nr:ABC transporter substrate-binding protein [Comamonas serinivorans]ARU03972.1 ABC transporter permease [Comamonas serinivorans]